VSNLVWDLGLGAAIGYGAGRVMDLATGWFYQRQSPASRRREQEVAPGGTPAVVGKKLAGLAGRDVTDAQAARISLILHRSLGVVYGMAAAALVRAGVRPFQAGLVTGAAAFLLVDEGLTSAFAPPLRAYPVESHLRGVVGHLTFGATTGAMLVVARWLGALRPKEPG
jgi:hypothetical protein